MNRSQIWMEWFWVHIFEHPFFRLAVWTNQRDGNNQRISNCRVRIKSNWNLPWPACWYWIARLRDDYLRRHYWAKRRMSKILRGIYLTHIFFTFVLCGFHWHIGGRSTCSIKLLSLGLPCLELFVFSSCILQLCSNCLSSKTHTGFLTMMMEQCSSKCIHATAETQWPRH